MLDQRRAEEKGYITLKEAAKLANYTPDYVGQLIRAGKIKGEQVYSQVAWVTTPEEVQAYLSDKSRTAPVTQPIVGVLQNLPSFGVYVAIGICTAVILLMQYIFFVSGDFSQVHVTDESSQKVTMQTY